MDRKNDEMVEKRPKWSQKEVKKKRANLWDHDAARLSRVTPTKNAGIGYKKT